MFHAVRQWWSGGRGRVTLRLFLFEFVVVVAGVLTAQWLANRVAARAEARAVTEEDKRVRYEVGRARHVAKVWKAATPCLVARVEEIARKAASSEQVDSAYLQLPQFIGYTVEPYSADMSREFHDRLGAERVENYAVVMSGSQALVDNYREIRGKWEQLALIDPSLGRPSAEDRSSARNIAVQIRAQLSQIGHAVDMIESTSQRLGIAPLTSPAEFGSVEPVRNCEEIWKNGRVWKEAAS